MSTQQKRDFLTNIAYWALIIGGVYLALKYLLPLSVPFIFGILIAYLVVKISQKLHCNNKIFRICLTLMVYGIIGFLITLLGAKSLAAVSDMVMWLPDIYELKLLPFATLCYDWCVKTISLLDPAVVSALEMVLESLLSSIQNLISLISGFAVDLVVGVATGVPSLILSLLAMIFSSVFVVGDYERIVAFASANLPRNIKNALHLVREYLVNTLFVVIRSYALIMLLTFTELSILFSIFGISSPFLKAALIALLDILPILGTGGIMIPWAVISLVLGNTALGIKLFIIYGTVTVVRNYVEPKIVGTQLGLHPIITLFSMFIGLRLFGFWGLFGLPVGISFLWKLKKEKEAQTAAPQ